MEAMLVIVTAPPALVELAGLALDDADNGWRDTGGRLQKDDNRLTLQKGGKSFTLLWFPEEGLRWDGVLTLSEVGLIAAGLRKQLRVQESLVGADGEVFQPEMFELEAPIVAPTSRVSPEVRAARELMKVLLDQEEIELVEGGSGDALADKLVVFLDTKRKGPELIDWLLEQESVEEVYMDDEAAWRIVKHW